MQRWAHSGAAELVHRNSNIIFSMLELCVFSVSCLSAGSTVFFFFFCPVHVCRIGTGSGVKYRGRDTRTAKVTFDEGWIQIPPLSVYMKSVLAWRVGRRVARRKVCINLFQSAWIFL